jgi:hypothetical protein
MGLFLIMQLITLSFGNDKRSGGKSAPATMIDDE